MVPIKELANKKCVDHSLEGNNLKVNQKLQNYLKVFVGKYVCNLTNYDRNQTKVLKISTHPNQGRYLLQQLNLKFNEKIFNGKLQNLLKNNKKFFSDRQTVANALSSIGDSFFVCKRKSKHLRL